MKAIICEMCGNNEFIKEDGLFVCQSCGTKYTVEEAKKMMIEGPVDVSGSTVKLDRSDRLDNLYQLARRARDENNSITAAKYYNDILLEKPNDWEAVFYSAYYQALNCTIAGISSSAIRFGNSAVSALKLLKNTDDIDQAMCCLEMRAKVQQICAVFMTNVANFIPNYTDPNAATSFADSNTDAIAGMAESVGDAFMKLFNDETNALELYEIAYGAARTYSLKISLENKIKNLNPYFVPDTTSSISSSGGCYIATAVYGSYDCPQVWTLRRYRDNTLAETWYGRAFIHTYYAISPTLVKWFGNTNWFKKLWRGKLDRMVANLNANGVDDTPYEDRKW